MMTISQCDLLAGAGDRREVESLRRKRNSVAWSRSFCCCQLELKNIQNEDDDIGNKSLSSSSSSSSQIIPAIELNSATGKAAAAGENFAKSMRLGDIEDIERNGKSLDSLEHYFSMRKPEYLTDVCKPEHLRSSKKPTTNLSQIHHHNFRHNHQQQQRQPQQHQLVTRISPELEQQQQERREPSIIVAKRQHNNRCQELNKNQYFFMSLSPSCKSYNLATTFINSSSKTSIWAHLLLLVCILLLSNGSPIGCLGEQEESHTKG